MVCVVEGVDGRSEVKLKKLPRKNPNLYTNHTHTHTCKGMIKCKMTQKKHRKPNEAHAFKRALTHNSTQDEKRP